ncbi:MAG TPA: alpha/beta hydrolase [Planctomycetaceae bacterium]
MSAVVLIIVVLALIVLEILFQLLVLKFSLPIFEHPPPIGAELFPPVPDAEQVTIVTPDGVALVGSLLAARRQPPRGVILFCHELDSNRWSAPAYCEGLLAAGFHVLTFDFRNQGESQSVAAYQALHWPTVLEIEDALAAAAFIHSRPDLARLPLGIYGISRGGGVALAAAADCEWIERVVSDGAYCCNEMLLHFTNRWGRLYFPDRLLRLLPKWHVAISLWLIRRTSEFRRGLRYANVERALTKLRHKPVLMISGERDNYAFPESTRNLHARTGQDESTVWIVPAAKHNMARQSDPLEYDRRLVEFFSAPEATSAGSSGTSSVPAVAGNSGTANSGNGNSADVAVHGSGPHILVGNRGSLYSSDR